MRKPRNKVSKKIKDLTIPLDLTKIGTKDDPCFGNYSPKAEECAVCGDCEICQIVTTQKTQLQVEGKEKKGRFKDLEEVSLVKLNKAKKTALQYIEKRCTVLDKKSLKLDKVKEKLNLEHFIPNPDEVLEALEKEGKIKIIKKKNKIKLI
jgi:hypothetical protein